MKSAIVVAMTSEVGKILRGGYNDVNLCWFERREKINLFVTGGEH